MNILQKIGEEKHITLINYGPNDLSTSHLIKKLVDNQKSIINYYTAKENLQINNMNDYIDMFFLDYIISFKEFVDLINAPYKEVVEKLIDNANIFRQAINNKSIIVFINENYEEIFNYKNSLVYEGIEKRTLTYIVEFNKGLDFEEIMKYLIHHNIIFFIDNIESLYPIVKKHNKGIMNNLFDEKVQLNKIFKYRFEKACKLCIKFYRNNEHEIAQLMANKLYSMLKNDYNLFVEGEQPYKLVREFKLVTRTLKSIKNNNYYEAKTIYNKVEKLSDEYLKNYGQVYEYEISNKDYINLIEKTAAAKLPGIDKVFFLSHRFDENNLWASVLEEINNKIEPSVMDFVSSPVDTNDYFTLSRQQMNQQFIDDQSVNIHYWITVGRKNEFFSILSNNVKILFQEMNLELELNEEINYLKAIIEIIHKTQNIRQDISIYNAVFYIITLIEKILRELFTQIEEDAIFNIENHTLSKLLDDKSPILKLVGTHQIKWLRFYLLKKDNIGLDLRNRIAHYREIQISEITILDLYRMLWFLTSIINSTLINIINSDSR